MIRLLMILLVGVAIGYFVGFRDAQRHKQDIVERTIEKIGAERKRGSANDADEQFERIAR
jgi:hypothetical protein